MRKSFLITLIGLVLFKIALDYSYVNIIAVLFDYQNFYNNPSTFSIWISWFFLLSLSPLIVKTFLDETLSSNILTILILISLLPTTSMIGYNSQYPIKYVVLIYFYWLLVLSINLFTPAIVFSKKNSISSTSFYKILTITLCCTVCFVSWKFTGFRFHFGLFDVYDLRAEAREFEVSLLLGYLSTFSDNLLPVLLVFYLNKKQRFIALIIVVVILLNFGITATKQILFLLFFALAGFYFVKSFKLSRYYIWGLLFLNLICIFEFKIFSTYIVSTFSLYRIFFIPAKLHYVYYDFFSNRELDYFRQSAFKWFLNSPYKENIGFILGEHDIGDITARANNGLFSDAYLNLGSFGILFFPFILVFILKLLEGATKGLDERILFIVTSSVAFVLLGLPFTTALLSSGILVLIFFLYSLPRLEIKKAGLL